VTPHWYFCPYCHVFGIQTHDRCCDLCGRDRQGSQIEENPMSARGKLACPVCGTAYDDMLETCPHCLTSSRAGVPL